MYRRGNEKATAQDLGAFTGKTRLIANVGFSFTSRTNSTSPAPASSLFFSTDTVRRSDVMSLIDKRCQRKFPRLALMRSWWRRNLPSTPGIPALGILGAKSIRSVYPRRRQQARESPWRPSRVASICEHASCDRGIQRRLSGYGLVPEGGRVQNRIRGVVLLDALYGEVDKFLAWFAKNRTTFFVSAYTDSTPRKNATLKTILARQKIAYETDLKQQKWQHGVTFLSTNSNVGHWNFVSRAWADYPIKDLLSKLDEYRR